MKSDAGMKENRNLNQQGTGSTVLESTRIDLHDLESTWIGLE